MCQVCEVVWKQVVLPERKVPHVPWGHTFFRGVLRRIRELNEELEPQPRLEVYQQTVYDSEQGRERGFLAIGSEESWAPLNLQEWEPRTCGGLTVLTVHGGQSVSWYDQERLGLFREGSNFITYFS